MGAKSAKEYTPEQYLALEKRSEVRHEYHDGQIYAMAGGTYNHSVIGTNITTELNLITRKAGCTTFNGDMKIRIDSKDCFVYPEGSVVCGEVEFSDADRHAITNPGMIVEVLSESTEAYDRGQKFYLYQQLPSFREYVLIDQNGPMVSHFVKNDDGIWEFRNIYGLDQSIDIRILPASIPLTDIYQGAKDLREI